MGYKGAVPVVGIERTQRAGVDGVCIVWAMSELPDPAAVERIDVAVSPEAVLGIQRLMAMEHIDLTEAVRRLLGYGQYVYDAVKINGEDVLLRNGDDVREVVLLR